MFKNLMFQITGTLVAVAVLAYLVLHTLSSFENELEVKNSYYTTMDLTFDSTAYIFKDEVVLESKNGGYATYEIENGKKISTSQKVASFFNDSSSIDIQNQINILEDEIEYMNSIIREVKFSTPSVTSLDKRINERLPMISSFSISGNIREAIKQTNESARDLQLKYCVLKGTAPYEKLILEKEEEIKNLKKSLSSSSSSVYSPCSGYFYNETDGLENLFNFDAIENLSAASFEKLKEEKAENINTIGKIAKSSKWYIAFELKTEEAVKLSLGEKYSVFFAASGKDIQMKTEKRVDTSDSEKKIIVMSTNSVYDDFNFSRKQSISVTAATYSGIAFPSKAVYTDYDSTGASKAGVYVLDETIVKFKTFDKLMEKNGLILCAVPDSKNISAVSDTELSLYDTVIVEGTNLYNKKVIKNVLKTK